MNDRAVKKLALGGVMAALVFVMTYVPKIPVPVTGGYIHLGDGALDFQRVENFIRTRDPHALTYQVKGNCDMGVDLPEVQEIALGGVKLLATHGHRYQVKSTFTPIDVEAHHRGCAAALFGHTHQAYIEQRRTLLVNPGSARGDTLAMLKIENGAVSAEIMHF